MVAAIWVSCCSAVGGTFSGNCQPVGDSAGCSPAVVWAEQSSANDKRLSVVQTCTVRAALWAAVVAAGGQGDQLQ